MNIDVGSLFESVPGDISEEIFTGLVQEENVRIERII